MTLLLPTLSTLTVLVLAAAPTLARAQDPVPSRDTVPRDTLPRRDAVPSRDTIPRRDTVPARDSVSHTDTLRRGETLIFRRTDTVTVRHVDTVTSPSADSVPVPRVARATRTAGVRVCGGGDVTLGSNLDPAWAANAERLLRRRWGRSAHPDSLVAPLRPLVDDADIVLLNVESAIGAGDAPRKCGKGSTSCYAFRSPPEAAEALRSVAPHATVVGNVANNHARDAGPAGFRATMRHLRAAGVYVTGADTIATPVATANGDTVAFLGFYTSTEAPDARNLAAVRRHVTRAARRWRMVVVTTHMGAEGNGAQRTRDTTEIFLGRIDRGNPVAFARAALESGATLVIGHGPHVMRAAEWRDRKLAFYSLGNLLTYGPFSNREPSNRGAIACATITPERQVTSASVRSTMQLAPGVLARDPEGRAAALVDSLGRLDFPESGARLNGDGEVTLPDWPMPVPMDSVPPVPDSLPVVPRDSLVPRDPVVPPAVPRPLR